MENLKHIPLYRKGDIILETGSNMLGIISGYVNDKWLPVTQDSNDAAWYSLFVPGDPYCADGKRRYYKIPYADYKWLIEREHKTPLIANKVR